MYVVQINSKVFFQYIISKAFRGLKTYYISVEIPGTKFRLVVLGLYFILVWCMLTLHKILDIYSAIFFYKIVLNLKPTLPSHRLVTYDECDEFSKMLKIKF